MSEEPRVEFRVDRVVFLGIVVLLLGVALVVSALFTIDNRSDNNRLEEDVVAQTCSSANNIALAFRDQGDDETDTHFESRMRGQRFTLEQSLNLDCESAIPGFEKARAKALRQINALLSVRQEPEQDRSTDESTGGDDAPGTSGGRDVGDAGVDPGAGDDGDAGSGGGADLPSGSPDDPGDTDPPGSGGGGGEEPDDPGSGGGGGTATTPQDQEGLGEQLGETLDELTCGTTGQLGLNPAGLCP